MFRLYISTYAVNAVSLYCTNILLVFLSSAVDLVELPCSVNLREINISVAHHIVEQSTYLGSRPLSSRWQTHSMPSTSIRSHVSQALQILPQLSSQVVLYFHRGKVGSNGRDGL